MAYEVSSAQLTNILFKICFPFVWTEKDMYRVPPRYILVREHTVLMPKKRGVLVGHESAPERVIIAAHLAMGEEYSSVLASFRYVEWDRLLKNKKIVNLFYF